MVTDALANANLLERIGHLSRTEENVGYLYPAQWAALRYLSQANRFSRTPKALTRYLCTTRGTASQTLKALDRKGYITRKPSARDQRAVDIELTKEGLTLLRKDPIMHLVSMIETAIGDDGKHLRTHLSSILESLIKANDGNRFGECQTCRHFLLSGGDNKKFPHFCALLKVELSDKDSEKICVEHV
jgi:DNA-binding MarR family transcriptional regulator